MEYFGTTKHMDPFSVTYTFDNTDLRHAFEQIENMYGRVPLILKKCSLYGRIITFALTNVPNIKTDPKYMRIQKVLMKHGGNLKTGTNNISEYVSRLK